MQATQPVRRLHPMRAEVAALVAVVILVAAIVAASVVPSLARLGAGSDPGARPGATLELDPDAPRWRGGAAPEGRR